MNNNGFELLLVKDNGTYWKVDGITYSDAMQIEPGYETLRATLFTIEECKKALSDGLDITISKTYEHSEVQVSDLVITAATELDRHKKMALNEVAARIHQAIFGINVLDLMDYLGCYVEMLNAGYFITDSNREDKYFEVIENAQENEMPPPLSANATFEEEQNYIEAKRKYDVAQSNLNVLERYLNCYDALSAVKSQLKFFTDTREKIQNAKTIDDIDMLMKIYRSNLENFKIVN